MKVVCGHGPEGSLGEFFEVWEREGFRVVVSPEGGPQFAHDLRDAEILLHILRPVTREILEGAPQLRLVQKVGVGVNTIDLDTARARRIAVANMPGTNTQAVAEATLMLMLATLRNLTVLDRGCRDGSEWSPDKESRQRRNAFGEICGKTVGLVGAGSVARRLIGPLQALGAKVIYTSRTENPDLSIERCSLEDLLHQSDIISLHVPLTSETESLINREKLSLMKAGAVLINTARGGLVEETALIEALKDGRLRAAGLDVIAEEPPPSAHPLHLLENVVLTPHVAWLTKETLTSSFDVALENARRLRDGRELLHRIV